MGIRESLLNTITSVGSSDFVRIVTSAGASSKATLANVIKSFETGLGAKTSLTTSDYIRVVGSDNNLYKQSVESVANTIIPTISHTYSPGANTVDTVDVGIHYCVSWVGYPLGSTAAGYLIVLPYGASATSYGKQLYSAVDENGIYMRTRSNGTWSEWVKLPTRAEMDALALKTAAITGGALPLYVSRMGDVIFLRALYINPSSAITAGAWSTLGVLPTGYRPSATAYIGGVFTEASGRPHGFRGSIATDGTINGCFEDSISTSISLFGTVVAIVK